MKQRIKFNDFTNNYTCKYELLFSVELFMCKLQRNVSEYIGANIEYLL